MSDIHLSACPDGACPTCSHPRIIEAVVRAIGRCRNAGEIVKAHACGRRYTREQWDALKFGWFQDDEEGGLLETRQCVCGSHLALGIGPSRTWRAA